jgi:hypothetical protein
MIASCGRIGFEPAEGEALGFCEAQPPVTFCSDFDDGAGIAPWTSGKLERFSTLAVDDTGGLSAPSSLVVTMPSVADGDTAAGYIAHELGVAGTHLTASLDVMVEEAGDGDSVLLQIRLSDATTVHLIEYVYEEPPQTGYMEEFRNAQFDSYALPSSFPIGEWHRISVEVQTVPAGQIIVRRDDQLILDTALKGSSSGEIRVAVGLLFLAGPSAQWKFRFDNVVTDVE